MSISEAVAELRRIEDGLPERFADVAERPSRYFHYREWLIRSSLLRRLLGAGVVPSRRTIPGLDMPQPLGARVRRMGRFLAAGLDLSGSTSLALRADALFLNTNLRGFYLAGDRPVTLKAAIRDEDVSDDGAFSTNLESEIEARRYAGAFLPIPPILDYDTSGRHPFLLETVVWGTRPHGLTAEAACDRLLPGLLAMYEDRGYDFRPPAELLGGENVLGDIEGALRYLSTSPLERDRILSAMRRLLDCERGVGLSFVHGDLAPNNLLIQPENGQVLVFDWERAGEGPVARDFFYLLREAPARRRQVAEAARRSQEQFALPSEICSLEEQLATVGAMALARWGESEEQCRLGNRSPRDVRRQLLQYARLIETLPMRTTLMAIA